MSQSGVEDLQLIQISNSRGVKSSTHLSVVKARQDAKVHIFTAALLDHICSLYEPNPYRQQKILQGKAYNSLIPNIICFTFEPEVGLFCVVDNMPRIMLL